MARRPSTLASRDDATRLVRKVGRSGSVRAFRRSAAAVAKPEQRVIEHWNEAVSSGMHWWDIPAVTRRWAVKISGDAATDFRTHAAQRYFNDGVERRALSLGCGFGRREMAWAGLGVFSELTGVDIAPHAVEVAESAAREAGYSPGELRFRVGDNDTLRGEVGGYDVVIFEHSLHHFSDVSDTLAAVSSALRPGGLLLLDEYVGPTKFQWTRRQVEAADALLKLMPEVYRRRVDAPVKKSVRRPSLLAMRLDDPSEAVDASAIMPRVRELFDVQEEHGYGGALLHPMLADIAQNFLGEDECTRQLLDLCFTAEDVLLQAGEVDHDFAVVVARKR